MIFVVWLLILDFNKFIILLSVIGFLLFVMMMFDGFNICVILFNVIIFLFWCVWCIKIVLEFILFVLNVWSGVL